MKLHIAMLLPAVSLLIATPSSAADFPKQGEAEYDAYYVSHILSKLETAAGAVSKRCRASGRCETSSIA